MDNRRLLVVSDEKEDFRRAMELAWAGCPGSYASGFAERDAPPRDHSKDDGLLFRPDGTKYVVLFWHKPDPRPTDYQSFLGGRASLKTTIEYLWGWLQEQPKWKGDDGFIDGEDGGIGRGFAVFNEEWGHMDDDHYAFVAICPMPAMYGK